MSRIVTIKLPDIGEGVVEGQIIEWLKEVGDEVKQDEAVVIVMTDKATVELPSPHQGRLTKQYYQAGETAHLEKPLYDIEVKGEEKISKEKPEPLPVKESKPKPLRQSTGALATPPIRRLAKELGIPLQNVRGTGKDGRITQEDLQQYITEIEQKEMPRTSITPLPNDEIETLKGIRHFMVKKMTESKRNTAQFSYFEQVEVTRLIQLRKNIQKEAAIEKINLTYMPFIIRALSLALKRYREFNSSLDEKNNSLIIHKVQHIGIAMATKKGLIVPVLREVQVMNLEQTIKAFENLKAKAIQESFSPDDLKGSTITISNFGVLEGSGIWATPILNYPEVAILGIAKIHKQPIVKNNEVVSSDILNLSWTFDHRVIDGDMAAKFSHYFATLIKNPATLLT